MSPIGEPIPDPDCCNRAQREIDYWRDEAGRFSEALRQISEGPQRHRRVTGEWEELHQAHLRIARNALRWDGDGELTAVPQEPNPPRGFGDTKK